MIKKCSKSFHPIDGYTTEDLIFYWKSKDPVQVTTSLNLPTFSLYKHVTGYCTSRTNTGKYFFAFQFSSSNPR